MAIFFNGLNKDIQDMIKLHDYASISTLAWKEFLPYHKHQLEGGKSPKKGSAPFKGHREDVSKVNDPNSKLINKVTLNVLSV
ncbi:hypothetical protein CR513_34557, partial [Mucuna pruriens]